MGAPASQDFLLKLSPELRNIIYSEVLYSGCGSVNPARAPSQDALALFRTSQYIHVESSSYFYAKGHFTTNISSSGPSSPNMFPPIADRYLRFVKHLDVGLRTGCGSRPEVQDTARKVGTLGSIGAKLEELNFSIRAAEGLSPLLNSRLDDSILDVSHPITVALRHILKNETSKIVRLRLENTWFAVGVVAELQTTFGSRLQIQSARKEANSSITADALRYERELRGCRSTSPLRIFSLPMTNPSQNDSPRVPFSDASFNSFLGLESSLLGPCMKVDFENEEDDNIFLDDSELTIGTDDEELTEDDDVDIDGDLISIDKHEINVIAATWEASAKAVSNHVMNTTNLEFLTIMAPEIL